MVQWQGEIVSGQFAEILLPLMKCGINNVLFLVMHCPTYMERFNVAVQMYVIDNVILNTQPLSICLHSGFGGFAVILNEGMYRVSIVCKKKRGCPRLIETVTVAAEGKPYSTATHFKNIFKP